ncbi:MAG: hypothetical protein KBC57_06520 [Neisseriaceae bacterium]|nr:hypothetical protein [Neisseriaceae bacterium]MBP6861994.1 hypothetical protein [Neisseriaceae bacterium]
MLFNPLFLNLFVKIQQFNQNNIDSFCDNEKQHAALQRPKRPSPRAIRLRTTKLAHNAPKNLLFSTRISVEKTAKEHLTTNPKLETELSSKQLKIRPFVLTPWRQIGLATLPETWLNFHIAKAKKDVPLRADDDPFRIQNLN